MIKKLCAYLDLTTVAVGFILLGVGLFDLGMPWGAIGGGVVLWALGFYKGGQK